MGLGDGKPPPMRLHSSSTCNEQSRTCTEQSFGLPFITFSLFSSLPVLATLCLYEHYLHISYSMIKSITLVGF